MDPLNPKFVRRMFIVSSVMMIVAVALSVFNTAQVLSAPMRTVLTVPQTVGFEGFLANSSGEALSGTYELTFHIYNNSEGVSPTWTEIHYDVPVTNGLYSVVLGDFEDFDPNPFIDPAGSWIGVSVDGAADITPLTRVSSVPFSLNADNAQKIGGGGVEGMVAAFDGPCPDGWHPFTAANGRVIVGNITTLGGTVGTALTDMLDRTHTHTTPNHTHASALQSGSVSNVTNYVSVGTVTFDSDGKGSAMGSLVGGGYSGTIYNVLTGTQNDGASVSGSASTSDVIPYIQLNYCRLDPQP